MQKQAVAEMLNLLPEHSGFFEGTEYPLPVRTTFLGSRPIDAHYLRQWLLEKQDDDVKDVLEPVLLAAELCEASYEDKSLFFITDHTVRGNVFMGSKWKAGWVLILGGTDQSELIGNLQRLDFMVFTDLPGIPDTVYIGSRDTSPVYFLQMMVRYGLVWGNIAPGDDHEMGHFLERDMPGFIIIKESLPPLKYLMALGIMKLGAPAVVPSSFPFPYGNRVVADNTQEIVERGIQFPNLRLRYYNDEVIKLPDYCNPAFSMQKVNAGTVFGGNANSFFCVRPAKTKGKRINTVGRPSSEMGIVVEIANEYLSYDMALVVEQTALRSINFLDGVRAYDKDGVFYLELESGRKHDSEQTGEAVYWGIRLQYPRLEDISVNIIFEAENLKAEAENVRKYKNERLNFVDSMTEDNTEEFCACTECRPFSLVHTCIITPEWIPMCASRTYFTVKAAAYFGLSSSVPYKRQSEKLLPLKHVFKKGKILDAHRGEYEGCNQIYSDMTGDRLNRVYMHSVREFPPTSCGCFQNLAFWLEDVKGIAIMSRDSKATAPDGQTWDMLANRAGGKQSPGITGVSISYIRSPHFLKGDGGMENVVWVDSGLYGKVSDCFLPGQKVATENDVSSMAQLKDFIYFSNPGFLEYQQQQ